MASNPLTKTDAIVCYPPSAGKRTWVLGEIHLMPPLENEVLVELVASGVCHTDLGCGTSLDGTPGFPVPPYPRVLGHEGAGYVRSIGAKVTKVKPGDAVLLSFAFCTACWNCRFGAPGYCERFSQLNFTGLREAFVSGHGDSIGGSFFGQSSFARVSRVQETSVVNVSGLVKDTKELRLFAPLGCGFQTGAGTITELAKVSPDDRIAILGLGGVGLSAIMAAKLKGCKTIIGIDRVPARLELATSLGAMHVINTSLISGTLAEEVRRVTGGRGVTVAVEATGSSPLVKDAVAMTANQGKIILVGVAPMDARFDVGLVEFMVSGKQLLGSMEGGVYPEKYIPQLIEWYRSGQFPVEKLIKFYQATDFQQAIEDMESGATVKPVLIW
ncbi:hypothetical protein BJX99DRAFT_271679 [Aspergillus californicus]